MKLIVGLGNVGKEYEKTIHNMGFIVADKVCSSYGLKFNKNYCQSIVAEGNINGQKVIIAKPTTYMNLSGVAVKSLVKKFNIDTNKDLFIICDDFDLPRGTVRVKTSSSAGTHNGLRNIVECLNTIDFIRLKIGVGRTDHFDAKEFVLSNAKFDDELNGGIEKGVSAVQMFIENEDLGVIQQKVN